LPEIHNFARTIQEQAAHRSFNRIVQPRISEPKWPQIESRGTFEAQTPFTLSAVARGKELQLTMVLNGFSIDFVFNHGLVPPLSHNPSIHPTTPHEVEFVENRRGVGCGTPMRPQPVGRPC